MRRIRCSVQICDKFGETSNAIATHFWFTSVGVEDAHAVGRCTATSIFGGHGKYDLQSEGDDSLSSLVSACIALMEFYVL